MHFRPLTLRSRRKIRKASADDGGVAFMEFALALPFLCVTFLGGLELVNLAIAHQQISRVATSTADLAARFRSSIDETDVETLFLGSRLALRLADFDTRGRIILSSVTANQPIPSGTGGDPVPNGHVIRWQRCEGNYNSTSSIGGEGDGLYTDGTPWNEIPTIDGMEVLWPNTVMFAEVTYQYEPIFGTGGSLMQSISSLFETREIKYRAAFIARELSLQTITNTTEIPDGELSRCPWTGDEDSPPGDGGGPNAGTPDGEQVEVPGGGGPGA